MQEQNEESEFEFEEPSWLRDAELILRVTALERPKVARSPQPSASKEPSKEPIVVEVAKSIRSSASNEIIVQAPQKTTDHKAINDMAAKQVGMISAPEIVVNSFDRAEKTVRHTMNQMKDCVVPVQKRAPELSELTLDKPPPTHPIALNPTDLAALDPLAEWASFLPIPPPQIVLPTQSALAMTTVPSAARVAPTAPEVIEAPSFAPVAPAVPAAPPAAEAALLAPALATALEAPATTTTREAATTEPPELLRRAALSDVPLPADSSVRAATRPPAPVPPALNNGVLQSSLKGMFPALDEDIITAVLRSTSTAEQALNQLLQMTSDSRTPTSPPKAFPSLDEPFSFRREDFSFRPGDMAVPASHVKMQGCTRSMHSRWSRTNRKLTGTMAHVVEAARSKVGNHGQFRYGKVL